MPDDLSVNYSVTPPTADTMQPAPRTASRLDNELVAFADCELIGIDQQKMLVINRVNGKQQFFSPQVVDALKTCTTFDSIRNHTIRLCTARPELKGQEAAVSSALQQLSSGGFLLHGEDIRRRLVNGNPRTLAPSRVFINTCDRPEAIERLLESMLRSGNLSRHDALFLVDDSRLQKNQQANKALVEKFNLRSARDIQYFGPEEQSELLHQLIGAHPEHEAGIRFLIDPNWGFSLIDIVNMDLCARRVGCHFQCS